MSIYTHFCAQIISKTEREIKMSGCSVGHKLWKLKFAYTMPHTKAVPYLWYDVIHLYMLYDVIYDVIYDAILFMMCDVIYDVIYDVFGAPGAKKAARGAIMMCVCDVFLMFYDAEYDLWCDLWCVLWSVMWYDRIKNIICYKMDHKTHHTTRVLHHESQNGSYIVCDAWSVFDVLWCKIWSVMWSVIVFNDKYNIFYSAWL